jgi:3-phosphoshikimate 1-carboxyvinyltransferase
LRGPGGQTFAGGEIACIKDHRIAMSAAIAGWCAEKPVTINCPEVVQISFPKFFKIMDDLVEYQ